MILQEIWRTLGNNEHVMLSNEIDTVKRKSSIFYFEFKIYETSLRNILIRTSLKHYDVWDRIR